MTEVKNRNLHRAKREKNDEFYTQFRDIEREVGAYLNYDPDVFRGKTVLLPCDDPEWSNFTLYFVLNFARFGIKKLISTSYAPESKGSGDIYQPSLFESENSRFDKDKSKVNGKIFVLNRKNDEEVKMEDLDWDYLKGDGDFRSEEVTALRDEADIIVTNPPFSLFREFIAWIMEAEKKFIILGNMNAITYKEVFPLIKDDKVWLGVQSGAKEYTTPDGSIQKMGNTCWFTNMDHGRRHEPMQLMTMADNLRYSKHAIIKEQGYQKYDNYDAIEVPYTIAIPSDYAGVMGVPISFLDKYCPEQFEILGCSYDYGRPEGWDKNITMSGTVNGRNIYKRILIRHRNPEK